MIKRLVLLISSSEPDLARQEQEESALNTLLNAGYAIIIQKEVEQRHVGISILLVLWRKDDEIHSA